MMDDVEKSAIIYEMNNINQKVLNEISTYANNRERIQNLTDEFTEIMYHDRISNNDVERIDYISLGNIPLSVATRSSLSSQGVPISVITTAVIKVRNEKNSILTAIEQFTGRNEKEIIDNIQVTAIAVLEGKLREIIATMTVEELYQKREEFSSRVQEVVGTELGNMGLEVMNFTITDISDENGYIKALGDGMIAQRKKDAEIQKAEAARDMQIKT